MYSGSMEELDTRTERLESDNVNTDQLQAAHPAPSACKASSGQFAAAALGKLDFFEKCYFRVIATWIACVQVLPE